MRLKASVQVRSSSSSAWVVEEPSNADSHCLVLIEGPFTGKPIVSHSLVGLSFLLLEQLKVIVGLSHRLQPYCVP